MSKFYTILLIWKERMKYEYWLWEWLWRDYPPSYSHEQGFICKLLRGTKGLITSWWGSSRLQTQFKILNKRLFIWFTIFKFENGSNSIHSFIILIQCLLYSLNTVKYSWILFCWAYSWNQQFIESRERILEIVNYKKSLNIAAVE